MDLKGTKTEENLKAALAGESIARNRYAFFAEAARKEGMDDVAEFFERLERNEKEHARVWYRLLYGDPKETLENLAIAAQGEHDEWTDMYVKFAEEAREEGFHEISKLFTEVKRIERNHERENIRLTNRIKNNESTAPETKENILVCGYCGFSLESNHSVKQCPLCGHHLIAL